MSNWLEDCLFRRNRTLPSTGVSVSDALDPAPTSGGCAAPPTIGCEPNGSDIYGADTLTVARSGRYLGNGERISIALHGAHFGTK